MLTWEVLEQYNTINDIHQRSLDACVCVFVFFLPGYGVQKNVSGSGVVSSGVSTSKLKKSSHS